MDGERLPPASHLAVSAANGDRRGLGVGVGVNPVLTRSKHGESEAWRIDLEVLILLEVSGVGREDALRQLDLDRLIVQVQELECRICVQTQRSRSHVNLRSPAVPNPDLVTRGKRTVDVGIHPVRHAGRLQRHRTVDVTQPSHPAWRIRLSSLSRKKRRDCDQ
jgi:hypothetical protein